MATKPINREFKDRLFKLIFGNPLHKDWTLELFNALNDTNFTDPDAIEFNTIEDAVYMGMKNDVSFILMGTMNFFEQQSTLDRGVPVRFLSYFSMALNKQLKMEEESSRNKYGQREIPIPTCVCFYNGLRDQEDKTILRLSDCFKKIPQLNIRPSVEVTVTMININYGRNSELFAKCKPLSDYSWFVAQVRLNQLTMTLEEAIDAAVRDMPDDSVLKPFLEANKAEVKSMWILEYDEKRALEDQWEAGRAEGRMEERLKLLSQLVKDGDLSLEKAASMVEMTPEEFVGAIESL